MRLWLARFPMACRFYFLLYLRPFCTTMPLKETSTRCPARLYIGSEESNATSAFIPLMAVVLGDRKSTRLNSSHANISYAVFCLKKKSERQLFHLSCPITRFNSIPPP